MSRILALDQASKVTGWAVFEDGALIKFGKFSKDHPDMQKRLDSIKKEIQKLIQEYDISKIYYEDIQLQSSVGNNVQTFKVLAYVQATVLLAAQELNLPTEVISSNTWKSHIKIKARKRPEQKREAQQYVTEKYNIKATQDESDAICLGEYAASKENSEFNWA